MKAVSLISNDALTLRGPDTYSAMKPARHTMPALLIGLGIGLMAACTDNAAPEDPGDDGQCFPIPANAQVIEAPPRVGEELMQQQGTELQGATPGDPQGQGTNLQGEPPNIMQNQGDTLQGHPPDWVNNQGTTLQGNT